MTLRKLILQTLERNEFDLMVDYLLKADSAAMVTSVVTRETTHNSYKHVIDELLALPPSPPYKFPIHISKSVMDVLLEPGEVAEEYIDVAMINPNFVEPPEELKPWGCREGENAPEGFYNVNDEKHNKYFGFGLSPWSHIIDTEIVIEVPHLAPFELLAEILWELTFYGWSETKQKEFGDMLVERMEEAKREIDAGECTTLPKKEGDKFTVVIPDCVKEQIKKI